MNQAATIVLTAPKNLWQKEVKLSVKDTLTGLIKGAIDFASGKPVAAGKSLVEIVFKGELATEVGEKAWVLVVNSLMSALKDLLADQAYNLNNPNLLNNIDAICDEFAEKLGEVNYSISPQFFEQPQQLLSVTAIADNITAFFEKLGYAKTSAMALANRFPAYFTFSLHREWRDNHSHYQPVFDAIATPFVGATLQQEKLALYKTHLIKQAHESVFGEPISLKQIYMPLNAYYVASEQTQDTKHAVDSQCDKKKKHVVKLHDELTHWAMNDNSELSVRVISGGPGAGKSSFTKIWAAEMVDKISHPLLYIPLHYFVSFRLYSATFLLKAGIMTISKQQEQIHANPKRKTRSHRH